jgi:hypothetical protein
MNWTGIRLWLAVGALAAATRSLAWLSHRFEAWSGRLVRISVRLLERTRNLP